MVSLAGNGNGIRPTLGGVSETFRTGSINNMDLTESASHKRVAFAMSRGARRRRRRFSGAGGTLAVGLLLLMICSVPQFISSGQASEKQPQQPSQLFLLAAQRAPISLVPRINQKRPDEEVDGFLMQAQMQNGSTTTQQTTPPIKTTSEQAAITFETTTTTAPAPATSTSQENDDSRIPIDANRQQFVTHDQLTNASGADGLMSSESKISQSEGAADQEAPSIGDGEEGETATNSTDHRDQQWQRAATKVSYVIPGILSGKSG